MTLQNEVTKNSAQAVRAAGAAAEHVAEQVAINAVAGFGFRANATVASLREALHACQAASASLISQPISIIFLATAEDKVEHPALLELAHELGLGLTAVPLAQLITLAETATATDVSVTMLSRIPKRYGARSLAETSALVAAGLGAQLLAPRSVSADKMATAAIAVITTPLTKSSKFSKSSKSSTQTVATSLHDNSHPKPL